MYKQEMEAAAVLQQACQQQHQQQTAGTASSSSSSMTTAAAGSKSRGSVRRGGGGGLGRKDSSTATATRDSRGGSAEAALVAATAGTPIGVRFAMEFRRLMAIRWIMIHSADTNNNGSSPSPSTSSSSSVTSMDSMSVGEWEEAVRALCTDFSVFAAQLVESIYRDELFREDQERRQQQQQYQYQQQRPQGVTSSVAFYEVEEDTDDDDHGEQDRNPSAPLPLLPPPTTALRCDLSSRSLRSLLPPRSHCGCFVKEENVSPVAAATTSTTSTSSSTTSGGGIGSGSDSTATSSSSSFSTAAVGINPAELIAACRVKVAQALVSSVSAGAVLAVPLTVGVSYALRSFTVTALLPAASILTLPTAARPLTAENALVQRMATDCLRECHPIVSHLVERRVAAEAELEEEEKKKKRNSILNHNHTTTTTAAAAAAGGGVRATPPGGPSSSSHGASGDAIAAFDHEWDAHLLKKLDWSSTSPTSSSTATAAATSSSPLMGRTRGFGGGGGQPRSGDGAADDDFGDGGAKKMLWMGRTLGGYTLFNTTSLLDSPITDDAALEELLELTKKSGGKTKGLPEAPSTSIPQSEVSSQATMATPQNGFFTVAVETVLKSAANEVHVLMKHSLRAALEDLLPQSHHTASHLKKVPKHDVLMTVGGRSKSKKPSKLSSTPTPFTEVVDPHHGGGGADHPPPTSSVPFLNDEEEEGSRQNNVAEDVLNAVLREMSSFPKLFRDVLDTMYQQQAKDQQQGLPQQQKKGQKGPPPTSVTSSCSSSLSPLQWVQLTSFTSSSHCGGGGDANHGGCNRLYMKVLSLVSHREEMASRSTNTHHQRKTSTTSSSSYSFSAGGASSAIAGSAGFLSACEQRLRTVAAHPERATSDVTLIDVLQLEMLVSSCLKSIRNMVATNYSTGAGSGSGGDVGLHVQSSSSSFSEFLRRQMYAQVDLVLEEASASTSSSSPATTGFPLCRALLVTRLHGMLFHGESVDFLKHELPEDTRTTTSSPPPPGTTTGTTMRGGQPSSTSYFVEPRTGGGARSSGVGHDPSSFSTLKAVSDVSILAPLWSTSNKHNRWTTGRRKQGVDQRRQSTSSSQQPPPPATPPLVMPRSNISQHRQRGEGYSSAAAGNVSTSSTTTSWLAPHVERMLEWMEKWLLLGTAPTVYRDPVLCNVLHVPHLASAHLTLLDRLTLLASQAVHLRAITATLAPPPPHSLPPSSAAVTSKAKTPLHSAAVVSPSDVADVTSSAHQHHDHCRIAESPSLLSWLESIAHTVVTLVTEHTTIDLRTDADAIVRVLQDLAASLKGLLDKLLLQLRPREASTNLGGREGIHRVAAWLRTCEQSGGVTDGITSTQQRRSSNASSSDSRTGGGAGTEGKQQHHRHDKFGVDDLIPAYVLCAFCSLLRWKILSTVSTLLPGAVPGKVLSTSSSTSSSRKGNVRPPARSRGTRPFLAPPAASSPSSAAPVTTDTTADAMTVQSTDAAAHAAELLLISLAEGGSSRSTFFTTLTPAADCTTNCSRLPQRLSRQHLQLRRILARSVFVELFSTTQSRLQLLPPSGATASQAVPTTTTTTTAALTTTSTPPRPLLQQLGLLCTMMTGHRFIAEPHRRWLRDLTSFTASEAATALGRGAGGGDALRMASGISLSSDIGTTGGGGGGGNTSALGARRHTLSSAMSTTSTAVSSSAPASTYASSTFTHPQPQFVAGDGGNTKSVPCDLAALSGVLHALLNLLASTNTETPSQPTQKTISQSQPQDDVGVIMIAGVKGILNINGCTDSTDRCVSNCIARLQASGDGSSNRTSVAQLQTLQNRVKNRQKGNAIFLLANVVRSFLNRRSEITRVNIASRLLRRIFKGFAVRQRLAIRMRRQFMAIRMIQKVSRGYLITRLPFGPQWSARVKVNRMIPRLRFARKVQRFCAGYLLRKKVPGMIAAKRLAATETLQAVGRGYAVRRTYMLMLGIQRLRRLRELSFQLQRVGRAFQARHYVAWLRHFANLSRCRSIFEPLQPVGRAFLQRKKLYLQLEKRRKDLAKKKRIAACRLLIRGMRGLRHRLNMSRVRRGNALRFLQRLGRGYWDRQRVLTPALLARDQEAIYASQMIQRVGRSVLSLRKLFNQKAKRRKAAAAFLVRNCNGFAARLHISVLRHTSRQRRLAAVVERIHLGRIARQSVFHLLVHYFQRISRGYLGRKFIHQTRVDKYIDQKRKDAAALLQRVGRGFNCRVVLSAEWIAFCEAERQRLLYEENARRLHKLTQRLGRGFRNRRRLGEFTFQLRLRQRSSSELIHRVAKGF